MESARKEIENLLEPETIRHELGKLELLKNFGKRDGGLIVGGKVKEGKFRDSNKFIVYRGTKVMGEGVIAELRIGPDKRSEVQKDKSAIHTGLLACHTNHSMQYCRTPSAKNEPGIPDHALPRPGLHDLQFPAKTDTPSWS